jgi:hypothetical protein
MAGYFVDVPLYCCEVCGWATTALRVDAVREHYVECPACAGTMRLAFDVNPSADKKPILAGPQAKLEHGLNRSSRPRADRRGLPFRIRPGGLSPNGRPRG